MSPTIFRAGSYRFYFYSKEEARMHIHVRHPTGRAKFWVDPKVELALNYGLALHRPAIAARLIEEHRDEIRSAWQEFFWR